MLSGFFPAWTFSALVLGLVLALGPAFLTTLLPLLSAFLPLLPAFLPALLSALPPLFSAILGSTPVALLSTVIVPPTATFAAIRALIETVATALASSPLPAVSAGLVGAAPVSSPHGLSFVLDRATRRRKLYPIGG
jgi:hypothetical protein